MDHSNLPPEPRALREFLIERTGVEPEMTLKKGKTTRIVLEHRNERVRLTITYRFGALRGVPSWHQTGSTLEILGQPVNLADDPEEYVRVFNDGAEPTGPGWEAGGPASRPVPQSVSHNLLTMTKAGSHRVMH